MVRHLRLRQVLISQGYTRKELRKAVAFEHRNWKEDRENLPTIEQVRKMHETLGTWDKEVKWLAVNFPDGYRDNCLHLREDHWIFPKSNYYKEALQRKLERERRWKEQENRTLEFFEREGC